MSITHEEPTKPTRRRRSAFRRTLDRVLRWLRYVTDADYARRHDAGKKAAATRRQNAEDLRVAEDIARNETARIFKSDPTP